MWCDMIRFKWNLHDFKMFERVIHEQKSKKIEIAFQFLQG